MSSKEQILSKIDGLLLVTEDHRERLKQFVSTHDEVEILELIEKLVAQEPEIIHQTVHDILEEEVMSGNGKILQIIDDAIKKTQPEVKQAMKVEENNERGLEETMADQLLNDF